MSTKFTKLNERPTSERPLGLVLHNAHQWISTSLLALMHEMGHKDLTASHLSFFSSLDCGLTHASAVGRRLGISRQAVYKTTKELTHLGILELIEGEADKRQKVISMTARGEQVALDARACMAKIEGRLSETIGEKNLQEMLTALRSDWGAPFEAH